MNIESRLTEELKCSSIVVIRWDQTECSPTRDDVLDLVKNHRYQIDNTNAGNCLENQTQCMFLTMNTDSEATRLCQHSVTNEFVVNNTKLQIHRLIQPNGIRLQDAIDFVHAHHKTTESDIDLLLGLTRLELPERAEIANSDYRMIRQEVGRLVENGTCITFGSFSSPVRRNGYSDIDICVESIDSNYPEPDSESASIRPLEELIANPKILLDAPLTRSEFYSYPPKEVIKMLDACFQENKQFTERFHIRVALARTPIIIFKSHTNGMDMSYDLSVNNMISVEKTKILNLFITKDKSKEGRTRKVLMFIVFWAKTNRLINGTYPDERLEVKTGLWSYIINQLVIHFIQVAAGKELVKPGESGDNRVEEYSFDELFEDYTSFFLQFFRYYANFDYSNNAIYGKQVIIQRSLGEEIQLPFMLIDPLDNSHIVSAFTTNEALNLLKELCRNAVLLLETGNFRVDRLLQTNDSVRQLKN